MPRVLALALAAVTGVVVGIVAAWLYLVYIFSKNRQ